MKYLIKDHLGGEPFKASLKEILNEINRDRSDDWIHYNKSDWREGLNEFTYWEILNDTKGGAE